MRLKGLCVAGIVVAAVLTCSYEIVKGAGAVITVKGSDTMVNLCTAWAEAFMKKTPGTQVAVTGGGSGTGIAALINRRCDIANASRQIKAKELEDANNKGIEPKRVVVAIDALSIIVSAQNPVGRLTVEQIGKIYRGDVKNWRDVGGSDMSIALYGRQSNSGTYDFMKEVVMKGEYAPSLKSMNGNAQIAEAVKQDESGIGYIGVGYAKEADGVKVLEVSSGSGMGYYSPLNVRDVKDGNYPITRPLNQYVDGMPRGAVKDFIAFELSAEGQRIVEDDGFFAIPPENQRYNDETMGRQWEVGESPL